MIQCIETDASRKSVAHYSPGTVHNGVLYVSGQLPRDMESGQLVAGGIREQALKALENVEAVLKLAGCKKEDVIKCTIYTTDGGFWGDINDVYKGFFGQHKPARVLIPIGDIGNGCLVEIDAIADIGGNE